MIQNLTTSQARKIFYGAGVLFSFSLIAIVFESTLMLTRQKNLQHFDGHTGLERVIVDGQALWENHACDGCHSLLGEGAYFAPELSDVLQRYGDNRETLKSLIRSGSIGVYPWRRTMHGFDFTDKELHAIIEFLQYSSKMSLAYRPLSN